MPRRDHMGAWPRRLAAVAVFLTVALAPGTALAQGPSGPEVIETDPYYLSMHEGRGEHRGTVLTLHGGGWRGDFGPEADQIMREYIRLITGWGYDVANLGYRGGAESIDDALDAFDRLRADLGDDERLCIFGGSAGAQLALVIAARRGAEVDCVVDFLGPPDLANWGSAPAGAAGLDLARDAFGEDRLAELSPINFVDQIESPVLVAAAPCDAFIELDAQRAYAEALADAGADVRLQVVATGEDISVGHCWVSRPSYNRLTDSIRSFLAGHTESDATPADEESGSALAVILAGIVVVGGLGLLFWSLRRRA